MRSGPAGKQIDLVVVDSGRSGDDAVRMAGWPVDEPAALAEVLSQASPTGRLLVAQRSALDGDERRPRMGVEVARLVRRNASVLDDTSALPDLSARAIAEAGILLTVL